MYPILPLISQRKLQGRKRMPKGLLRSAELLEQPAGSGEGDRWSIRVDGDDEAPCDARVSRHSASARSSADSAVQEVKTLVHRMSTGGWQNPSSDQPVTVSRCSTTQCNGIQLR